MTVARNMWKFAENIAAIASACVVAQVGDADPGAVAGGIVAASGLIGYWAETNTKRGPESRAKFVEVRDRLLDEIENDPDWQAFAPELREGIGHRLYEAFDDLVFNLDEIGKIAVLEGFPVAVGAEIFRQLGAIDAVFKQGSDEYDPGAARFASTVIGRSLELAWEDREFFQKLFPYLQKHILDIIREDSETGKRTNQIVEGIKETVDELVKETRIERDEAKREISKLRNLVISTNSSLKESFSEKDSKAFESEYELSKSSIFMPDQILLEQLQRVRKLVEISSVQNHDLEKSQLAMIDVIERLEESTKFDPFGEERKWIKNEIGRLGLFDLFIAEEINQIDRLSNENRFRFYCTDTSFQFVSADFWEESEHAKAVMEASHRSVGRFGAKADLLRLELLTNPREIVHSPRLWDKVQRLCYEHLSIGFKIGFVRVCGDEFSPVERDFFLIPDEAVYWINRDFSIHGVLFANDPHASYVLDQYEQYFMALRRRAIILSDLSELRVLPEWLLGQG